MKTDEIRSALCNTKLFEDVYNVDTLPARSRGLLVCNLEPSYSPGTHWVAIYVDPRGKRAEYFDSFGRGPCKTIKEYLDRRCKRWTHNTRQLQSVVSWLCGHYCIHYCMLRSSGIKMREIANSLSTDTAFSDALVHAFVCRRLLNNNYPVIMHAFVATYWLYKSMKLGLDFVVVF